MRTGIAAVLAAFLFMGAMCSATVDIPTFIAKVQEATVKACGYMPLADFINAVLQTNESAAVISMGANAFAHMICDRVGPAPIPAPPPAPGTVIKAEPPPPTIAGVPITGHYVVQ